VLLQAVVGTVDPAVHGIDAPSTVKTDAWVAQGASTATMRGDWNADGFNSGEFCNGRSIGHYWHLHRFRNVYL
jgi:hypothetical protein